jgi:hypothetical protein
MALGQVGGNVEHVAPGALLEPVLQLAGDKLVGVVAGPVRKIDDEAVALGDLQWNRSQALPVRHTAAEKIAERLWRPPLGA